MEIIDERNTNRKPFIALSKGAVFEVDNDVYIKLHESNCVTYDSICVSQDMALTDFAEDDFVLELKAELHIVGTEE